MCPFRERSRVLILGEKDVFTLDDVIFVKIVPLALSEWLELSFLAEREWVLKTDWGGMNEEPGSY